MAEEAGRALWERLEAHHKAGYLSLHMPGHKENAALAPYLARLGAELDITELPEFDDLHDPSGVLAQGMDRAAKLWGSRKSYFQVNGSTGGLLAAIRAAGKADVAVRKRHIVLSLLFVLDTIDAILLWRILRRAEKERKQE